MLDACPCVQGADLDQVNPLKQKDKKIVDFTSKRISDVEQR